MVIDLQIGLLGLILVLLLVNIGYMTWINVMRSQTIDELRIAHISLQHDQSFLELKLEIHEHILQNCNYQIHDNIGQVLSLAKLYVADIQEKHPDYGLEETHYLLGKAITDLRYVSKGLQPSRIGKQTLRETIAYELGLLEKISSLKTELTVSGSSHEIHPEKKVRLFNIFQAVMANTLLHADKGMFHTHIAYDKETLMLTMDDIGNNCSTIHLSRPLLSGISSHLKHMQGNVDIKSLPGAGTRITIQVPYS